MATAVFRNNNRHGVNPTGSRRIPPGGAIEVESKDAAAYEGCNGVEKLTGDDAKDALAPSVGPSTGETVDAKQMREFSDARTKARMLSVAAPLQVVVGDDQAPYGPPTGVRSTKAAEAQKDLAHRIAFADNEALEKVEEPEEKLTPHAVLKTQVVHNQQVEAGEAAEEAAKELVAAQADSTSDDSE